MLKFFRKGFTLIEIIVVIVIIAVLMAIAVPSLMSYMNEGKKAKYYAVSRSAYTNMTVEISKLEADNSNYPNLGAACKGVIEKVNNSSSDDLKIIAFSISYDDGLIFQPRLATIGNTKNPLQSNQTVDHIKSIHYYFGTSEGVYSAYTTIYPNKKVEYHSLK